jgi:hypothetical protein
MENKNIWLSTPIHKNWIPEEIMKDEELISSISISIDGSIFAVRESLIKSFIDIEEIKLARLGMRTMPNKFEVKNLEDVKRMFAHLIEESEDDSAEE